MKASLPLAAALALLLTACAPSPELTPSPTPTPAPAFQVQPAHVPPGDYAPWQRAYAAFLTDLRQREGEFRHPFEAMTTEERNKTDAYWEGLADAGSAYRLYDVDKDGIPELFVEYGTCEADYHSVCYTFREERVVSIGDFHTGHTALYTCPGENGGLCYYGQMGVGFVQKFSIADGRLVFPEDFYREANWDEELSDYPPASSFVPGSEAIPSFEIPTCRRPNDCPPLTLPIYDYGIPPRQTEPSMEEAEVRAAIGRVLWGGAPFFGVSGDGFWGDTGTTTLEQWPMSQPEALAWADVNRDGQTDCLLRSGSTYTILTLMGDTIYGYHLSCSPQTEPVVLPNGAVYFPIFPDYCLSVRFYGNQCYSFSATPPAAGDGLAWESFVPAPSGPEFSPPPGDYAPWQRGYMDFLTDLCRQEAPLLRWMNETTAQEKEADPERQLAAMMCSDVYWLCDVDKDGTPELFVRYGNLARMDEIFCYTYRDGEVARIGTVRDAKGASLYAWPGENALLNYWAWKGAFILWKYSIVDGELVCTDEDGVFSQFGGPGEPDPRDYVPDPLPLQPCRVRTTRSEEEPMLLLICAGGERWSPPPTEGADPAAREAVEAVLYREAPFYSVTGSPYFYLGDTGWTTLNTYCQESAEAPVPYQMLWLDLDGDGAEECILRLKEGYRDLLVLRWQDGVVYGYGVNGYDDGDNLTAKGVFYRADPFWVDDAWGKVLSFHQDQCYWTAVPLPAELSPAAWESFPSTP